MKNVKIKWHSKSSPNGTYAEHTACTGQFGFKVTNFPNTRTIQLEVTHQGSPIAARNLDKAEATVARAKEICIEIRDGFKI